jgi:hypothetical protein
LKLRIEFGPPLCRMLLTSLLTVDLTCGILCGLGSNGWTELFNGRDLTGWKQVGPGSMIVEDGLLKTQGGMGLLYWTRGKIGNCMLRVVYRMQHENDNSGVFIRIPIEPRDPGMPVLYAYEVQIDNHPDPTPPRKFDNEPIRGMRPQYGYFGIQNDSDKSVVYFREIALKKLATHSRD